MATLSIVIPAYNEEDGIAEVIKRVLRTRQAVFTAAGTIDELEVMVVDDASQDRTREIATGYEEVTVITHEKNEGYGAALKTGFEKATGEYIGFIDADTTYPPEHFPNLCKVMIEQDADMVIGSRSNWLGARGSRNRSAWMTASVHVCPCSQTLHRQRS